MVQEAKRKKANDPGYNRDEWTSIFQINNPWKRGWFDDEEASSITGLSVRNLRTVQTEEFISAATANRPTGAPKRAWTAHDTLRACLVSEVSKYGGLSLITSVKILQLLPKTVLIEFIDQTALFYLSETGGDPDALLEEYAWPLDSDRRLVQEKGDISLSIVNRRYVFLEGRFPELEEDTQPGLDEILIGVVHDIYSRYPKIKPIPGSLSNEVAARVNRLLNHPVSVHRINLELALRQRIALALDIPFQR